jgi:pimeloyl-ACP methyl ester carboxylesterase
MSPFQVQIIRGFIKLLGSISPRLVATWLASRWSATKRYPISQRQKNYALHALRGSLSVAGQSIASYAWGQGPPVLLVHGWNGQGLQLGGFIDPLLKHGFRVISFDAPGHGCSTGKHTNIYDFVGVIKELDRSFGPYAGIIAHSFGVPCTTLAVKLGVRTKALVLLSGPINLATLFKLFTDYLDVPVKIRDLLRSKISHQYGADIWQIASVEHTAVGLNLPTLIVHDKNDRGLAWRQAEKLAGLMPQAELKLTEGLGHHRILIASEVTQAASEFIFRHGRKTG